MNIRMNYWLWLIYFGLTIFMPHIALGQCNDKLVDRVINQSGNDALFIREFALDAAVGKKQKAKAPGMTKRYDIRMNKSIVYRFIVLVDEPSQAQAFLQLKNRDLVLANTYDIDKKINLGTFDYLCEESGAYQVIMSFVDENTACAAGAMFAIIQDSVSLTAVIDSTDIDNILYTGTDNYIDIAASDIPGGTLEVSISRGTIEKEGGLYNIRVEEPGKVIVSVIAKEASGKIKETFNSEFLVSEPMLPVVTLARNTGGIIRKEDILASGQALEVAGYSKDLKFKVKRFSVSQRISVPGIVNENDNRLNFRQIDLIRKLNPGETFYITNIEIEDSKGKIYHLQPIGYIISE